MNAKVKYVIEQMDKHNTKNITIQCKLTSKEIKEFQKNGIEVQYYKELNNPEWFGYKNFKRLNK